MPVAATLTGAAADVNAFCFDSDSFSVSGTFDAGAPIGAGTYSGTVTRTSACNEQAPGFGGPIGPPATAVATVTFSSPGGSFVAVGQGTTLRSETVHTTELDSVLSLTVQSGTRRFARAAGELSLTLVAASLASPPSLTSSGTLSGLVRIA